MLGWLLGNRKKKLERAYAQKLEEARDVQRRGDIIRYSELMAEADELLRKIELEECNDCKD